MDESVDMGKWALDLRGCVTRQMIRQMPGNSNRFRQNAVVNARMVRTSSLAPFCCDH